MERICINPDIFFPFSLDFYKVIYIIYLAKWFFLASVNIPGKWFIFYYGCIRPSYSGWTALSVQRTSQSLPSWAYESFHLKIFLQTNFTTGYLLIFYDYFTLYQKYLQLRFIFFCLHFCLPFFSFFLSLFLFLDL